MMNLLQFLKNSKEPVTKLDLLKAGFIDVKKELKRLQREELIVRIENFAHNTIKKYKDKDGNLYTYEGTKFYTYQATPTK